MSSECPLPRVGSKEWGWTRFFGGKGWYASKQTQLQVDWCDGKWHVLENGTGTDPISRASCNDLPTAKRIAELLTRLDWKREMRGKK